MTNTARSVDEVPNGTDKSLQDKVALVTGASRGIGRAIAEKLGGRGASVVVNYANNADKGEQVVRAIGVMGGAGIAVQGDVTNAESVRRLFDEAENRFGKLDIVVSSAGGATAGFKPLIQFTDDEFERVFALNARGAFYVLREAAQRVNREGRIVCISSAGTAAPAAGGTVYIGAKAAVEQFAYGLSKELGEREVTVNVVSAGLTDTDALVGSEALVRDMVAQTPLGRLGRPRDIADVVAYVVSAEARWVTGQNIRATGGLI